MIEGRVMTPPNLPAEAKEPNGRGATLVNQTFLPGSGTVCSYTEWDPLEEVIVGIVDGATFPSWHMALPASTAQQPARDFRQELGTAIPARAGDAARE